MRNRISWNIVRLAAGLLTITMISGGTAYAASVVQKNSLIGEEAAEEFAMLEAGLAPEEISGMHTDLEKENGQYVYDIVFYADGIKYEYELSAEDGRVLEKETEKKQEKTQAKTPGKEDGSGTEKTGQVTQVENSAQEARKTGQVTQEAGSGQKSGETTYISVDEAKQIALDHAELTEEKVRFTTAKFEDGDDGKEYEIEFYVENMEYEYEIDAITGAIREFSKEKDDD